MIVISGALVLVALVLLVIGLISTALGFVYASIAVSVVSFVFLLIGILQRRGEPLPEAAAASGPAPARAPAGDVEGLTAIIPGGRATPAPAEVPAEQEVSAGSALPPVSTGDDLALEPLSGSVLVVQGRPRYHVSGCRYLTGKDPQEVPVEQARADGFSACGVCKPDAVLAQAPAADGAPAAESVAEPVVEPVAEPVRRPARKTAATTRRAPAAKAPAAAKKAAPVRKAAPVQKAPVQKAPVQKAAAKKAPAKKAPATRAPADKAAPAAPAKKAPAKKASATQPAARKATGPAKKTTGRKAPGA